MVEEFKGMITIVLLPFYVVVVYVGSIEKRWEHVSCDKDELVDFVLLYLYLLYSMIGETEKI